MRDLRLEQTREVKLLDERATNRLEHTKRLEREVADGYAAYQDICREAGILLAQQAYGLAPNDVIEVSQKTLRGVKKFRLRIDYFESTPPFMWPPSIHGTIIRADGSLGTKKDSCYPTLD